MKTKHVFVPLLDVGELLPFVVKAKESLQDNLTEQDRAKQELVKFITHLEKQYKEGIFYMGMDIIESKSYERFIFEKEGFFEIMTEAPLAMNAHFIKEKTAKKFSAALKKAIKKSLPDNPMAEMLLNSIEVQCEQDQSLTYAKWDTMKDIKKGTE